MEIIGIKILKDPQKVRESVNKNRVLCSGWFPLGNYSEPLIHQGKWTIEKTPKDTGLYNLLFDNLPKISVCAIVGRNGSGKSTLIDYLLMMVNNVACILLQEQYSTGEEKPTIAFGVYADLFFYSDVQIKRLRCWGEEVTISDGERERKLADMSFEEKKTLASQVSYTVLINYGAYSLNPNDYGLDSSLYKNKTNIDFGQAKKINGDWLKQLFKIEQNYIFPIAITPKRYNGNIDINEHQTEAMEKLVSLMLFSKIKQYSFMEGYEPVSIFYKYNPSVISMLTDRIAHVAAYERLNVQYLMGIKTAILEGWLNYVGCMSLWTDEPNPEKKEEKEVFDALLDYMACQTLILCSYYGKFGEIFSPIRKCIENEINHGVLLSNIEEITELKNKALFETIVNDQTTPTYGIRRCYKTLQDAKVSGLSNVLFLQKDGELSIDNIANLYRLEDVLFFLPPPIYQLDISMMKQNIRNRVVLPTRRRYANMITFSKLSSGEKQQLLSLSSALFHIKSVEESIANTKGIGHKTICLIFDEAELYYHPAYQRDFLFKLLKYLSWLGLGVSHIGQIQIVVATHSPFILSDILQDRILFLKDGSNYKEKLNVVALKEFEKRGTFGANYYHLLRNGFFLEDNAIGLYASKTIGKIISLYGKSNNRANKTEFLKYANQFSTIADAIGDDYLKKTIKRMVCEMALNYGTDDTNGLS